MSLALALGARRRRKGWPVVVAVVLAVVPLVVPSASLVGIARATIDGGGRLNPLTALAPGSMAAAPDRTVRTGAGRSEVMDVYAPEGTTASSRTRMLFAVHGGGWNTDATMPATLRWFANHGWLVVRPHYTLATSSTPTWNLAPRELAAEYAWLAQHATELGGDPGNITVFGDSAGGGLGINLAYQVAGRRAPYPALPRPGSGTASARRGCPLPHR